MKKALLVTRVSGFIPQHEINNVKILQGMGYEIHYATDLHNVVYGSDNSALRNTGIITHQIDFVQSPFSKDVRKSYLQLKKLMLSEKFDLIHCHMPMSGVIARVAAEKIRRAYGRHIPVLYTAHGFHFFTGSPLKNWIYYPVERLLARYTDRLIVINHEDYLRAKKFPIRGNIEYVPGVGVEISQNFDNQMLNITDKIKYIRNITGKRITNKTKVLSSIGVLSRVKNHQLLIDMMAELRNLDIICIIGGTGEEENILRKKIKQLHLEEKVFLAGYVYNVSEMLHATDCFVLPSYREGLPVVVMEAMVAGIPVIASQIRGVVDLVEHKKGGYLVKKINPESFAAMTRKMFVDKYNKSAISCDLLREQMGKWNQERVKTFSKDIVEKKMREIYMSVDADNNKKH